MAKLTTVAWSAPCQQAAVFSDTRSRRALFPLIAALLHWGDTWAPSPGGPPVVFIHDTCGNVTQPMLTCPHCHGEGTTANTRSVPRPGSRPAPEPARQLPARNRWARTAPLV